MQKIIKVGNRTIAEDQPAFIIAELSANHAQDLNIAKETIIAAKESGADAIKLQTYTADTLTIDSRKDYFKTGDNTLWAGQTLYELYKKAYMPWEWHFELKELAEKIGLIFFSTPFDRTSVDFLEKLDVPLYKIASPEITDIPLIEYVARLKKPILISTGAAFLSDIDLALRTCIKHGNTQIILMKCVSVYPTPLNLMNIRSIKTLSKMFNCLVGLSDHSKTISAAVAAVALGAKVIEKHFILSKKLETPDKDFSLDPQEFSEMVKQIREIEKALGSEAYEGNEWIEEARKGCRSIFAVRDIKKGEVLNEENIKSIRPGHGLHPKYMKDIIGRRAKVDIEKGTPLKWELIE